MIAMTKSRKMRCAGHVACIGENFIQSSGWNPRKKETTRKVMSRRENGVKMGLKIG
jgi:hypothetical protein